MKRKLTIGLVFFLLLAPTAAGAGEAPDDTVFRAMQDEMDRSMGRLVIEGMEKPWFVSYLVQDNETVVVEARYGALVNRRSDHQRYLYTQVRVGSPELDNTGYIGGWRSMGRARTKITVDDDYDALRRQLWLVTDREYKLALENLAGKQAHLQAHPPRTPVADFSEAEPLVALADPVALEKDLAGWEARVRLAAETLGEFGGLQDWTVRLHTLALNKRYLNSEGSRHLKGLVIHELEVSATAQAADGQRLTSFQHYMTAAGEPLPDGWSLADDVRAMAAELEAMAGAEVGEGYSGPVLFSGEASAQFVDQLFASQLSPPRPPLLANEWMRRSFPRARLAGKIKRRVFPEFVTVTDDPAARTWEGHALAGHLPVDDEGVAGRPVVLVRNGRLVGLPLGRRPTRDFSESNGHVWASPAFWPMPRVTSLFVETADPAHDLTVELRRLAGEFGLEYGLLVTRLEEPRYSMAYRRSFSPGDTSEQLLSAPVGVYRVYVDDGRMEPLRGLVFDEVTVRALRDVGMLGDDPVLYNRRLGTSARSVIIPGAIVTPSILVEEIDLREETTRETVLLSTNPMFGE